MSPDARPASPAMAAGMSYWAVTNSSAAMRRRDFGMVPLR
jgi:hypothetical protein